MSKRRESIEEMSLVSLLRQEARRTRPEFSETLHRRIVRSVRGRRGEETAAARPSTTVGRRRLAVVLAAAGALAAAMVGWRLGEIAMRPGDTPGSKQTIHAANAALEDLPPVGELTDRAATGIGEMLASAGWRLPSTQLAHDAQLAADSLLHRLPIEIREEDRDRKME